MADRISFWRKIENVMESQAAFYVNAVVMVLSFVGILAYVVLA